MKPVGPVVVKLTSVEFDAGAVTEALLLIEHPVPQLDVTTTWKTIGPVGCDDPSPVAVTVTV